MNRMQIMLQLAVWVSYGAVIAVTIILALQVQSLEPALQGHPQAEGIAVATPPLFFIMGIYFTTRMWWSVMTRRLH